MNEDFIESAYRKWKARGGGMHITDTPEEREIITKFWKDNLKPDTIVSTPTPTPTPEPKHNEVIKLKEMVNKAAVDSAIYANKDKNTLDMPTETLTSMSEAVKKYFYENRRKQNSDEQK